MHFYEARFFICFYDGKIIDSLDFCFIINKIFSPQENLGAQKIRGELHPNASPVATDLPSCATVSINVHKSRVAESEVKCPTPTFQIFPKFPTP